MICKEGLNRPFRNYFFTLIFKLFSIINKNIKINGKIRQLC